MKKILTLLMLFSAVTLCAGGKKESLTVAYQDRIVDAALIMTVDEIRRSENAGMFEFIQFSSGSLSAEALINGGADIASMGDAVAVSLASRYPDKIVLVAVHGTGAGRHRLASAFGDLSDVGSIGIKYGTSTHSALLAWMERSRVMTGDVSLIDLSPDLQLSALASGEIDALAASEPTPSIAAQRMNNITVTPIEVEGRSFPVVLVARRSSFLEKKDLIEELVSKIGEKGNRLAESVRPDSDSMGLLVQETGLDEGLIAESMGYHSYGSFNPRDFIPEFDELALFLYNAGRIPRLPNWEGLFPE